jgi:hypothetical protein
MKFWGENHVSVQVVTFNANSKEAMGSGGCLIERCGAYLSYEVTHHKQIDSLLIVFYIHLLNLFELYTARLIILNYSNLWLVYKIYDLKNQKLLLTIIPMVILSVFCLINHKHFRYIFPWIIRILYRLIKTVPMSFRDSSSSNK